MSVHINPYWLDRPNTIVPRRRGLRWEWQLDDGRRILAHGWAWTPWGARLATRRAVRRWFP